MMNMQSKTMESCRRPESDKNEYPIIVFHNSQTRIVMTDLYESRAIIAAHYVTMSPHEWEWTKEQQAVMAQYVLWAHQRLAGIEQLITKKRVGRAAASAE